MYLCLPARLVTLVVLRVFAELTGPGVSAEAEGPTWPGVSSRCGLLDMGGVLLLTNPGPGIDGLVGFRSLLWYVLGPLNNPLGNPEVETGCSKLETAIGPDWVGDGPTGGIEGPDTSALSVTPNLRAGSSKMGYSKSTIPQEGMSGAGTVVVVDATEDDPGT